MGWIGAVLREFELVLCWVAVAVAVAECVNFWQFWQFLAILAILAIFQVWQWQWLGGSVAVTVVFKWGGLEQY
jgi:hypothetical protein